MAVKSKNTELAKVEDIEAELAAAREKMQEEEERIAQAYAEAEAKLSKLEKAKDSDFRVLAEELWKPTKPGDTLTGIYLGNTQTSGRVQQLNFGVVLDGERMMVRVNSGVVLRRYFGSGRVPPGTPCQLVFKGRKDLEGGRRTDLYDVGVLK